VAAVERTNLLCCRVFTKHDGVLIRVVLFPFGSPISGTSPLADPVTLLSAQIQASGEAIYTSDTANPSIGVYAAVVTSTRAKAFIQLRTNTVSPFAQHLLCFAAPIWFLCCTFVRNSFLTTCLLTGVVCVCSLLLWVVSLCVLHGRTKTRSIDISEALAIEGVIDFS